MTAAGMGRRLKEVSGERPKCLVPLGKGTLLDNALSHFRSLGSNEIIIVGGYQIDALKDVDGTLIKNERFETTNMLTSLFCARDHMLDEFLFSYSDIYFEKSVPEQAMQSTDDISLVMDTHWRDVYQGRELHPESEAELIRVENNRVVDIGKGINPDQASGEFIGMARFSKNGAKLILKEYQKIESHYLKTKEHPFKRASSFDQAYFTDMILYLIENDIHVGTCSIEGNWREIDTPEDLERVKNLLNRS